jgi:hypothetical protein
MALSAAVKIHAGNESPVHTPTDALLTSALALAMTFRRLVPVAGYESAEEWQDKIKASCNFVDPCSEPRSPS